MQKNYLFVICFYYKLHYLYGDLKLQPPIHLWLWYFIMNYPNQRCNWGGGNGVCVTEQSGFLKNVSLNKFRKVWLLQGLDLLELFPCQASKTPSGTLRRFHSSSRLSVSGIELVGPTAKRESQLAFGDTFFGAEGAKKWELLEIFGKNWVKWHIFGSAGAENFEKFRYFSEKSPNFVKVEDFIA